MEKKKSFGNKKKTYKKKDEKFDRQSSNYKGKNRNFKKENTRSSDSEKTDDKKKYSTEGTSFENKRNTNKTGTFKKFSQSSGSEKRTDNKYSDRKRPSVFKKRTEDTDNEHKAEKRTDRNYSERNRTRVFKKRSEEAEKGQNTERRRSELYAENKKSVIIKKRIGDNDLINNDKKTDSEEESTFENRKKISKSGTFKDYRHNSTPEKRQDKKYADKNKSKPFKKRDEGTDKEQNTEKKYDNSDKKYDNQEKSFSKSDDYKKRPYVSDIKKYPKKTNVSSSEKSNKSEGIRLNRFIAIAGFCSRREADTYIMAGLVTINGVLINELGVKVKPNDIVTYNDQVIKGERNVYVLLNKPKDYVTTMKDPHAKRTVMELVDKACKERIYPVGRLDRNTTGVLLLTNDGEMTAKLTHPKNRVSKIYHAVLDKPLTKSDMQQIAEGVELEDGFAKADTITYADLDDKRKIAVEIHSGKNRIVRRLFEHFEYRVDYLDRVLFAGLTKKNLKRGIWRFLTEKEVSFLKMLSTK